MASTTRPGTEGRDTLAKIAHTLRSIKLGLFGVLFLMSKKLDSRPWFVVVTLLVRVMQSFSFIVSTEAGAPWRDTMSPIRLLSGVSRHGGDGAFTSLNRCSSVYGKGV